MSKSELALRAADHLYRRGYTVARVGQHLKNAPPEDAPEQLDWIMIWSDESYYYSDEDLIETARTRGFREGKS